VEIHTTPSDEPRLVEFRFEIPEKWIVYASIEELTTLYRMFRDVSYLHPVTFWYPEDKHVRVMAGKCDRASLAKIGPRIEQIWREIRE